MKRGLDQKPALFFCVVKNQTSYDWTKEFHILPIFYTNYARSSIESLDDLNILASSIFKINTENQSLLVYLR